MRLLKLLLIALLLNSLNTNSQTIIYTTSGQFKLDERTRNQKEHEGFELNDISVLDLIEILELQGIEINKFKLGKFQKKYKLQILKEEYLNGKMISTDTILNTTNTYTHFESEKPFYDYIDQITIITKDIPEEKKSKLSIKTYGISMTTFLEMKNTEKENILNWRRYTDTKWELNKKIPILIYASSWLDKKIGIRRFCGPENLKENGENTNELLNYSPNYVKISYFLSE